MHPTLLQFGRFAIHSYGLMLAIAFLVAIQVFLARGRARGLSEDRLSTLSLWLLVLAIIGGRAFFVVTHWDDYKADPLAIVKLWEGGLMIYGGYILAIVGGIAYVRRAGMPVWRVADAAAPGMAIGVGIGRIGCFLNGCCFGLPTHAPWGIRFPASSYSTAVFPGEALQPSQLYMVAAGLGLFLLLLALDRKPRFDGALFWTYVAIDAGLRFAIDFTRYYDDASTLGRIGGLTFNVNQAVSVGLIAVSIVMLRVLARRPAVPVEAAAVVGADASGAAAPQDGIPAPSDDAPEARAGDRIRSEPRA
ncbi:MAG TPA: prolipoprotein diacylglyceryl transferase [Candidatus Eisenbacteria bacterium]